jgi:hypothetical protein
MISEADAVLFKSLSSAIAPVFMISAISALLASMNARYGRVIDRTRLVLREARATPKLVNAEDVDAELRVLLRRAKLLRLTVMLAATSIFSLAVCIFLIFLTILIEIRIPYLTPAMFCVAVVFLILSLAIFIRDFAISLHALRREIRVALGRNVVES